MLRIHQTFICLPGTELQQTETQQSVMSTVQQEMASRRSKLGFSRQDSRLSVKTLIESIENNKQVSAPGACSTIYSFLSFSLSLSIGGAAWKDR